MRPRRDARAPPPRRRPGSASIGATGDRRRNEKRPRPAAPSSSAARASSPRLGAYIAAARTSAGARPDARAIASITRPSSAPWRTSPSSSSTSRRRPALVRGFEQGAQRPQAPLGGAGPRLRRDGRQGPVHALERQGQSDRAAPKASRARASSSRHRYGPAAESRSGRGRAARSRGPGSPEEVGDERDLLALPRGRPHAPDELDEPRPLHEPRIASGHNGLHPGGPPMSLHELAGKPAPRSVPRERPAPRLGVLRGEARPLRPGTARGLRHLRPPRLVAARQLQRGPHPRHEPGPRGAPARQGHHGPALPRHGHPRALRARARHRARGLRGARGRGADPGGAALHAHPGDLARDPDLEPRAGRPTSRTASSSRPPTTRRTTAASSTTLPTAVRREATSRRRWSRGPTPSWKAACAT